MQPDTGSGSAFSKAVSIIIAGCLAVIVIDGGGAAIAKATGIEYAWFTLVSFVMYAAIGVVAARRGTIATAAIAGAVTALFEATIGWWISWVIGPGRIENATPSMMILTMVFGISVQTTISTSAGALWHARQRRRKPPTGV